ncbi:hypothetical protein EDD21DRAFT_431942 [Dissophora ornata]|nr:hypothetical protein EDD21DRAFT_431942 [Dissophora ornata]
MTTIALPPRAQWHDKFLLKIAVLSQTWPLALAATLVGVMECLLNVWQLMKQRDLVALSKKRRQLWIDQAKSVSSSGQRPRQRVRCTNALCLQRSFGTRAERPSIQVANAYGIHSVLAFGVGAAGVPTGDLIPSRLPFADPGHAMDPTFSVTLMLIAAFPTAINLMQLALVKGFIEQNMTAGLSWSSSQLSIK